MNLQAKFFLRPSTETGLVEGGDRGFGREAAGWQVSTFAPLLSCSFVPLRKTSLVGTFRHILRNPRETPPNRLRSPERTALAHGWSWLGLIQPNLRNPEEAIQWSV